MTDLVRIHALGRELECAGLDYALVTVVSVEGSSDRKPGALMLLTQAVGKSGGSRDNCCSS
jgi:xanthine/CO dehydrogenase XdhC/CoxF family maturation factor